MPSFADEERRRSWAGGDPRRADAKLRSFGPRVGDAIMCPRCQGDGLILRSWNKVVEPAKCPDCGGEGLDAGIIQGGLE